MKILLFNLGSVANRINSWGIEGFESIFDQDVVLWGPIPDEAFYANNKKIPIISIFEETSIKNVFERLPENWFPDIVTCDTSVLNFIPDIYLCPAKTILFTRDAWADTIFNRGLVEFFDFIDYGIIDRSLYCNFNVNILPLSNCAVSVPGNNDHIPEFEKRHIDVISIANYNDGFYHDRYKTLYKISDSNNTGIRIKYIVGIKRKEISQYYQQSKIVLDWAHTLSNRSFEAALNGCLLFSNEDNPVIREFWVPWEEYIPYNEDNVTELISFYLANPEVSQGIISKARRKIENIPTSMGQSYWEQIRIAYNTEIDVNERVERNRRLPKSVLHYRLATPLVYNYNYNTNFPGNWRDLYFQRIETSILCASDETYKILSLIEAVRMAFLFDKVALCEKYLAELEKILPKYAWIWYLRARESYIKNNMDQALIYVNKAIDCGKNAPDLIQKYVMPVMEKNNSCDGRRITDYLWQSVYNHNNEFQVKSLFHLCFELAGDIFIVKKEPDNAVIAYSEAVSHTAIPRCLYKLSRVLIESGNYETMSAIVEKAREDNPYDSILVFYNVYALCKLDKKQKALMLLKEHKKALNSFFGKKRFNFLRNCINMMILIKIFGRKLFTKTLVFIINFLDRQK
ncbi:MAG: glycosyltransferase family 1 protein [Bacteroidetes bacterium]|nr:glycosyltransferase family 1 protein [Bacteroidota bacterium]